MRHLSQTMTCSHHCIITNKSSQFFTYNLYYYTSKHIMLSFVCLGWISYSWQCQTTQMQLCRTMIKDSRSIDELLQQRNAKLLNSCFYSNLCLHHIFTQKTTSPQTTQSFIWTAKKQIWRYGQVFVWLHAICLVHFWTFYHFTSLCSFVHHVWQRLIKFYC